jgi:outer membrane protein assembly factor BamB
LVFTNPVISNGYVYIVASDSAGVSPSGGSLHKIDMATGSEVTSGNWPFKASPCTHSGYGLMRTTPTVVDSLIYVSGGRDSTFYCIRVSDGTVKWSENVGTGMYYTPSLVVGSAVYWGSNDHRKVYARNRFTGASIWDSPSLGGDVFFSPIYADNKVIVGTGAASGGTSRLYALDAADGSIDWQSPAYYQGFVASPTYSNGRVYASSDSLTSMGSPSSPKLFCFDASNGSELWSKPIYSVSQTASPAVHGGTVFAGSYYDGYIRAFNAVSGDSLWATYVGGGPSLPAISGNGLLFVTVQDDTSGGDLFKALDVSDGSVAWSDSIGPSLSGPAIVNDTVVAADFAYGGGTVYLYAAGSYAAAPGASSRQAVNDGGSQRDRHVISRYHAASNKIQSQDSGMNRGILSVFNDLFDPSPSHLPLLRSGVQGDGTSHDPLAFHLEQNLPNPFAWSTAIEYSVPEPCRVSLKIYDTSGRLQATLVNGHREPGRYTIDWTALSHRGEPLRPGVYFCRMAAGPYSSGKRMLIAR